MKNSPSPHYLFVLLLLTSSCQVFYPSAQITNQSQMTGNAEKLSSVYQPTTFTNNLPNPHFTTPGTLFSEFGVNNKGLNLSLSYSIGRRWGIGINASTHGFEDETSGYELAKYTIPAYTDILGNYVPAQSGSQEVRVLNDHYNYDSQFELFAIYYKTLSENLHLDLLGGIALLEQRFEFSRTVDDYLTKYDYYIYADLYDLDEKRKYGTLFAQANISLQTEYVAVSALGRLRYNLLINSSYTSSDELLAAQFVNPGNFGAFDMGLRFEGGFRRLHFFIEAPVSVCLSCGDLNMQEFSPNFGFNWKIRDPNAKRRQKHSL